MKFNIHASAGCAPGLFTQADWQAWVMAPHLPVGTDLPALTDMPAMLRRRLDGLGRMALQAAYRCQGDDKMPMVFASQHGDAARACALLQEVAQGAPLSPTDFSLSVHNAIGALYSIARRDVSPYTAVAAGATSVEAGLMEACGLLADGAREVLLVVYDAALPALYKPFANAPDGSYAWAWRISAPGLKSTYSLACAPAKASICSPLLPHGLDVWRFFLAQEPLLEYSTTAHTWRWQRDG